MKPTRLMLPALLLAILPSVSGGKEPVEESLLTGATLADMNLEHEALAVFLDVLKSSPGDKRALQAVKELAKRSSTYAAEVSTAASNNDELDDILTGAALEMLKEVREPELRLGFVRARRLFVDGQILLAYDVFRLLESRRPSQDWLRDEIRRYLEERVPRELERRRAAGFYGTNTEAYSRAAFGELRKSRWEGVYRNLGKLPQGNNLQKEAGLLMNRMKTRAALSRSRDIREAHLGAARQYFLKQDYAAAVDMLEAFIPVSGGGKLSARAWKELAIVYNYDVLMELVEKAENAMAREQYLQASALIASAQEQYPGNRKVTELMGALLDKTRGLARRRSEESPEKTAAATISGSEAPRRRLFTRATTPPHPRARKPDKKNPTEKEKAEADSLYLRGISAYATGDFDRAWASWSAALDLVPEHPKSAKALERLELEITKTR